MCPDRVAAKAAKRSAKIAKRALIDLERPVLAVRIVDPGITFNKTINFNKSGTEFSFGKPTRVVVTNHGKTAAMSLEYCDMFTVVKSSGEDFSDPIEITKVQVGKGIYGAFVSNGTQFEFNTNEYIGTFVNSTVLQRINSDNSLLFLCVVRFEDILRQIYRIGFCAAFDRNGNQFVATGDERFNYCTKEE
jgi:hypothetical protein